ncbi:uncharacterized protein LOC107782583 isoform X1 [Nicotiana tabacum]|uniref:Uncharacterized protein LOC107782583 isoform X1 n=1 Tax=Nicotiana tabacum TaxID=4097 RepID=A0A1S3Z3F8_TOBAC
MINGETNMAVLISVHIYSDMTATLVFDELPHSLSKVFADPQTNQNPNLLEFEHSTAAVILSVESANISDAVVISSELNSGLDDDKIEEEDFMTTNLNSQPLVIVTWDTKSEIERHKSLSIAPIFSDSGTKSGVSSSLFDEMPDHSGAFRYSLISEKVAAQYMLLHFPFDPGSVAGRVFDSIEIVFDNSHQLNLPCITPLSTMALGEKSMVSTTGQLLDTMSQPCDHSKMFLHELSAANILTPMVKYEWKNGNSSPTDKVFVESFRRIDTKLPWGGIETIANSAIGFCAGYTDIFMSKVAGELWVCQFIQELDMEFGCMVFDTLSDWVISVIFCDCNRVVASFPPDFGLPNCKWVDTGQVSYSFDIRQCSQIESPRFCATYLKLVQLNGLFPSCGGAYLFKLLAHKVKGATTSFKDGVYGYVPCPVSMFATENTTYVATKVTVSYVMSFYTIAMGCDICLLMYQLIYPNSSSNDFFHFTAAKFGVTNSSALLDLKSKWDSEPSNKRARNILQPTLSILAISSHVFSEALSIVVLLLETITTLDIIIDMDYILGDIPRATSSMMGYGSPYQR